MNLLLYDSCSYTQTDIMDTLDEMGIKHKNIIYNFPDITHDDFFAYRFAKIIQENSFDAVFSTNYYPVVAEVCHKQSIKYISWSYDSPLNIPNMEETLGYPTNYVFFFDRIEYQKYADKGFTNVYHMPLGVNVSRLRNLTVTAKDCTQYSADIALVGQLYESSLPGLMIPLNDYLKGYINAITETQLRVYGYNFIEGMLTDDIMQQINDCYRAFGQTSVTLEKYGLACTIAKEVTRTERLVLLSTLADMYDVKLYSNQWDAALSAVTYGGTVNYYTQMPKVFRLSKINLNPSLRCIQSAIPLRALDIMGCGGFLLSNYQPELAEYFENGVELALYSSLEDAVAQAAYYLSHDDIRTQIAQKGLQKITEQFSYTDRLKEMFRICGLS